MMDEDDNFLDILNIHDIAGHILKKCPPIVWGRLACTCTTMKSMLSTSLVYLKEPTDDVTSAAARMQNASIAVRKEYLRTHNLEDKFSLKSITIFNWYSAMIATLAHDKLISVRRRVFSENYDTIMEDAINMIVIE